MLKLLIFVAKILGIWNWIRNQCLFVDYIIADHAAYLPLPDDYIEDADTLVKRSNEDKVVNGQGKRLIEICKMCNLRVVNGRVGEDRSRGRITYVTDNGESVMDYVLCSPSLFDRIRRFEVLDPNQCSDHSPLICGVQIHISDSPTEFPPRDMWKWYGTMIKSMHTSLP